MLLDRKKGHAHAIGAGAREFEAKGFALAHEEIVRNLNQDAGAITGFGIASAGAPMSEVGKNLDSFEDDVVTLVAAHAGDESDTAGIMLVGRIV